MGVASSIWDCPAGFAARRGLRACGNPDQPPRSPALGRKDGLLQRYSAQTSAQLIRATRWRNDDHAQKPVDRLRQSHIAVIEHRGCIEEHLEDQDRHGGRPQGQYHAELMTIDNKISTG